MKSKIEQRLSEVPLSMIKTTIHQARQELANRPKLESVFILTYLPQYNSIGKYYVKALCVTSNRLYYCKIQGRYGCFMSI